MCTKPDYLLIRKLTISEMAREGVVLNALLAIVTAAAVLLMV